MSDALAVTLGVIFSAAMLYSLGFAVRRVWKLFARDEEDDLEVDEVQLLECSECGYDLRESPNRCPECGTLVIDRSQYLRSLSSEWPANAIEPRPADINENMVVLVSTQDEMEANLLCQQLEARGISTVIEGERNPGISHTGIRRKVYLRVQVYEGDFEAALNYLARAQGIPLDLWNEWLEHRKLASSRVENGHI